MRFFSKSPVLSKIQEPDSSPTRGHQRSEPLVGVKYHLQAESGPMSTQNSITSQRRQSVPGARPPVSGPYCPRRPSLSEILANDSPPPWTLAAFGTYCEQNLCSENLDFTMDARRYQRLYKDVVKSQEESTHPPDPEKLAELKEMWDDILSVYITRNGPKEVNIPGDIRETLTAQTAQTLPPIPELLDPALATIFKLMEESILMNFIREVSESHQPADEHITFEEDDRRPLSRAKMNEKSTSPALSPLQLTSPYKKGSGPTSHPYSHNPSVSSNPTAQLAVRPRSMLSGKDSYSSSEGASLDMFVTDDTSLSSPTSGLAASTPPHTPPASDSGRRHSPRSRSDAAWKKMSSKLGLRKKSTPQPKDGDTLSEE